MKTHGPFRPHNKVRKKRWMGNCVRPTNKGKFISSFSRPKVQKETGLSCVGGACTSTPNFGSAVPAPQPTTTSVRLRSPPGPRLLTAYLLCRRLLPAAPSSFRRKPQHQRRRDITPLHDLSHPVPYRPDNETTTNTYREINNPSKTKKKSSHPDRRKKEAARPRSAIPTKAPPPTSALLWIW